MHTNMNYKTVLIFTLGFDVKFQFKTILEIGKNIDKCIVIINRDKNDKVMKALQEIKKFRHGIYGNQLRRMGNRFFESR